jgi:hypothetical protein
MGHRGTPKVLGENEMKRTASVLGLTAAALALVLTPAGNAQSDNAYTFNKAEYLPGETIRISYDVTDNCEGTVGSTGFVGQVAPEFRIDPPNIMYTKVTAIDIAGEYRTSMKCDGVYVSKTFRIIPAPGTFRLDKTEVEAGGDISVLVDKVGSNCTGPATSLGFAAPIELRNDSPAVLIGNGKAVGRAGTYEAEMNCGGTPVRQQFRVMEKAVAPEAPAPVQQVKAPVQKAKAPVVKPKGAPQTGGGGTV